MKLSRQSLNIKFSYLAENSKFSRSNSYFSILTPTFLRDGFLNSCFQNPNENSDYYVPKLLEGDMLILVRILSALDVSVTLSRLHNFL